jgi:hypothetical protein
LGSAHLPGFVQEGAVIDLRPCDLAREVRFQEFRTRSPVLICKDTSKLISICSGLEQELGRSLHGLSVFERKRRLLAHFEKLGQPIAFDYVTQTSQRIARFMARVVNTFPLNRLLPKILNIWLDSMKG